MKHKLYPLWAILFSFTSCGWLDNDTMPQGLPPITQEGKGSYGCYVDGKLYTAYRNGKQDFWMEYYPYPDNGEFHLKGNFSPRYLDTTAIKGIELGALQNASIGKHVLCDTSTFYLFFTYNRYNFGYNVISTKIGSTGLRDTLSHVIGTLNLTRLTATNAAGTFEFKAWRDGYIDTVRVTEGRFDY